MVTFRRITKRDNPEKIAATAARYKALLTEALDIARRNATGKPRIVRDILATGTAEGLNEFREKKYAVVTFEAKKFRRTWLSLIGWQYLRNTDAEELADSMIDTVETNVHMTETDSWPAKPARRSGAGKKK